MKTHEEIRQLVVDAVHAQHAAGKSYAKIAKELGVPASAVWKWGQGTALPQSLAPLVALLVNYEQAQNA